MLERANLHPRIGKRYVISLDWKELLSVSRLERANLHPRVGKSYSQSPSWKELTTPGLERDNLTLQIEKNYAQSLGWKDLISILGLERATLTHRIGRVNLSPGSKKFIPVPDLIKPASRLRLPLYSGPN
jgi:hypothetical protein